MHSFDRLRVHDVPSPRPGPGEVLVDVKASSINFPDALMVQGLYQVKPPLPFSLSAECAGVVSAIGDGVTDWRVGERVAAWLGYGAARETVVVSTEAAIRIPDKLSDHQAAGLFVTYGVICGDRLVLLDGNLYAPDRSKVPYVIQLDTIFETFRCDAAEGLRA